MDAAGDNKFGGKKLCFFYVLPHNPIRYFLYIYSTIFLLYFQKTLGGISYNVPAVYDVLAARIRALRSKDQGRQNVAEVCRGNGAKRNDLGKPEPEPPTGGEA
jgi:hypothetical protein